MDRKTLTRNGEPDEFFVSIVRLPPLIFSTELHRGPVHEPVTHLQRFSHKLQFELWIFIGYRAVIVLCTKSCSGDGYQCIITIFIFFWMSFNPIFGWMSRRVTCDSHRRVLARILTQSNIFNFHSHRKIAAHKAFQDWEV